MYQFSLLDVKQTSLGMEGVLGPRGVAGVPEIMLCIGSIIITDKPTCRVDGKLFEDCKKILKLIRGTQEVKVEYSQIMEAE